MLLATGISHDGKSFANNNMPFLVIKVIFVSIVIYHHAVR